MRIGRLFVLAAVIATAIFMLRPSSAQAPPPPAPLELRADVPSEFGAIFPLEWGGGSLYDLKRRLAARGCMLDQLWLLESGRWRGYAQYSYPRSLQARFLSRYEAGVPAGRMHASCFDICTFEYASSAGAAYDSRCRDAASTLSDSANDASSLCTREFDPRLAESVLPILPIRPDLCIVRVEFEAEPEAWRDRYETGVSGILIQQYDEAPFERLDETWWEIYPNRQPFVLLTSPVNPPERRAAGVRALSLHAEAHELCHANQEWMLLQSMNRFRRVPASFDEWWLASEAGLAFVKAAGFEQAADGSWSLAPRYRAHYRFVYGADRPAELAAELCAVHLLERIGEPSAYSAALYDGEQGRFFWREAPVDFVHAALLPDSVRRWLARYAVLPSP